MKLIHNLVIGFAVHPGKLWILQTGKTYEMHVQVFDEENNRIRVDDVSDFPYLTKTLCQTSMKGVKKYLKGVNKTTRLNIGHFFVVSFAVFEQRSDIVPDGFFYYEPFLSLGLSRFLSPVDYLKKIYFIATVLLYCYMLRKDLFVIAL